MIPGRLLDKKNLTVFESLPKLAELHLPFSLADEVSIERISKLPELKQLTVGIDEELVPQSLKLLKSAKLDLLQLFVYSNELYEDELARDRLEATVKKQLPDVETHLVVLPKELNIPPR